MPEMFRDDGEQVGMVQFQDLEQLIDEGEDVRMGGTAEGVLLVPLPSLESVAEDHLVTNFQTLPVLVRVGVGALEMGVHHPYQEKEVPLIIFRLLTALPVSNVVNHFF